MYQSESAPWLEFYAWNTDGSAKTDLVYNTSGISIVVVRDNLANSSALTLSAASGPTDWAAGKFHAMGGNKYRVGIATASISSFTGQISVEGTYTGGVLTGVTREVSAYDPTKNPLSPTTPGRTLDVSSGGEAGIDLANVGSPTTTLNLSGLTIKNSTDVKTIVDLIYTVVQLTDASVSTMAVDTRNAILNRVLAGNHTTSGTVGLLLQFLDALISTRLAPGTAGRTLTVSADGKVNAELDSGSLTAIRDGLATAAAVQSVKDDTGTTLPAQSTAIYNRLGVPAGASMSADVAAVKADTVSLLLRLTTNAATAIQNLFHMITGSGSGSKFTTAALENGSAAGGASLEDIIAGVQSVSGGIIAAQDESALYITIGDTWTQDIESLGNLTNKTVSFAIKSKAKDADTSAVVMIVEGTGLTRLNGAATTAGWGSIEILDETAGDIRLRLESDATSLLTSGTYVDAVKALEDGDDRTLRQKGRTVVSAGVIADIT